LIREIEAEWTAHLGPLDTQHLRCIITSLRDITDPYA
jgi:hypothetical protein